MSVHPGRYGYSVCSEASPAHVSSSSFVSSCLSAVKEAPTDQSLFLFLLPVDSNLVKRILCSGLGLLRDRDQTRRPESPGPGLSPGGAPLHGDPAQQRAPVPEGRAHEGGAQLQPGPHRPGTAAVCSQRYGLSDTAGGGRGPGAGGRSLTGGIDYTVQPECQNIWGTAVVTGPSIHQSPNVTPKYKAQVHVQGVCFFELFFYVFDLFYLFMFLPRT